MDARDWDQRYRDSDLVWTAGPNQFVEEHTAALTPGRALDLASGEGRNALWLAERGWEVTALDFSEVAVERARRLGRERALEVDWRVADVTTEHFGERAHDLVLVSYLHLPEDELRDVHRRAAAAVAPGGTLLIVGHDRMNIAHGQGGPQDPSVLLDADDLVERLAGSGLDLLEAGQVTRAVATDGGERTAIDTLVVARRVS